MIQTCWQREEINNIARIYGTAAVAAAASEEDDYDDDDDGGCSDDVFIDSFKVCQT